MTLRSSDMLENRETINPYLHYGKLLCQRLLWDLNPSSWVARKRLKDWKNKFKGQKAVILCNGPSLNEVDFASLEKSGIFSFGLNKINLLFGRTSFRPSAIVAINPFVIEQNLAFYNATRIPLFIDYRGHKRIRLRPNVHFMHSTRGTRKFARDCSVSLIEGATVTFAAMQLSFHMGFEQVALVGCDHSFASKGPPNKTVQSGKRDSDHFDEKYFADGMNWQLPDLMASELQYDTARIIFERHNRNIVNCTAGGKLEIYERESLAGFLDR